MALSKPSFSANAEKGAAPAVKQPSFHNSHCKLAVGHEEELIRLRADMVCSGCRFGWLCCECASGCLVCKQRRTFCYCQFGNSPTRGKVVLFYCDICKQLERQCHCAMTYRCKWCAVSLEKCTRGGCVSLLPKRISKDAEPYVEIFNSEDACDDEPVLPKKDSEEEEEDSNKEDNDDDEEDKQSVTSQGTRSTATLCSSSTSVAGSNWSLATAAGNEWWETQHAYQRMGQRGENGMYASTSTISSTSSGGSYNSIGGRSDC